MMILKVIKTGEDSDNCREHFQGVTVIDYGKTYDVSHREYCTVDGVFHTFDQEPECRVREELTVIEVDEAGETVKVWQ